MGKAERQERYKTTGGASDLVKVETLVPAACRSRILELAAQLREEHRRRKSEVSSVVGKVRAACEKQPRRYTLPIDIDRIVVTSVNVPFPESIGAAELADALRSCAIPTKYSGHLGRFLGEVPLTDVLRFCDRHRIPAADLARYVAKNRGKLALHRPELEEHLHVLVPST